MLRLVHTSTPEGRTPNLDDEALKWVVRLTSGEAGEDEHASFRAWRDQSPEHAAALGRARALWVRVGTAVPRASRFQTGRRWAVGLSAAASLALCVALGDAYLSNWRYDEATEVGERRSVTLADGSRMTLSGDSAVDIRFENGVRAVDLARGEALFEIAHEQARPFIVRASGHVIRDIGTAFNVAHEAAGVDVTVTEGVVEVSVDEKRTMLTRGHAITLMAGRADAVRMVDASARVAWARGRLILEDKSLQEILYALRPHYRGHIVILDSTANERRMSVVIDLARIDEWLAGLAETGAVRVARLGNVSILI